MRRAGHDVAAHDLTNDVFHSSLDARLLIVVVVERHCPHVQEQKLSPPQREYRTGERGEKRPLVPPLDGFAAIQPRGMNPEPHTLTRLLLLAPQL